GATVSVIPSPSDLFGWNPPPICAGMPQRSRCRPKRFFSSIESTPAHSLSRRSSRTLPSGGGNMKSTRSRRYTPSGSTTMRWCWYEHSSLSGDRPHQSQSLKSSRSCARDGRRRGLEGLEPLRAYGYRKPDQFKSALVSDRAGPPGLGYALCAPPLLQSAVSLLERLQPQRWRVMVRAGQVKA